MATVDIDNVLPSDEITEPVLVTLSIEEVRVMVTDYCDCLPDDLAEDLKRALTEFDAGDL